MSRKVCGRSNRPQRLRRPPLRSSRRRRRAAALVRRPRLRRCRAARVDPAHARRPRLRRSRARRDADARRRSRTRRGDRHPDLSARVLLAADSGRRRRVHRLQPPLSVAARTAGFPHGVSALSDSRSPPGEAESSRTHQSGGSSMDSIVERAGQLAGTELKRVRWALGINGVLSIALAMVILIWPGISLFALAIVFGAFTAANGVVGLIAAIRGPAISGRGWLVLSSLVSIAFGVAVLVRTDLSALALLYVVGAYAITLGIITIGGGFWLPLNGGDRALLTLTGMVSVLFGIVMFAKPGAGALVLLALIAAYELVKGVSELVVAIGWKRLLERDLKSALASVRAKPQTAS